MAALAAELFRRAGHDQSAPAEEGRVVEGGLELGYHVGGDQHGGAEARPASMVSSI